MQRKGLKKKSYVFTFIGFNRFDQSKLYIETLIEAFPCSIELWIELLLNPELSQHIPEVNYDGCDRPVPNHISFIL